MNRLAFACKCGVKRFVDIEPPQPGIRQFEPFFLSKHCSMDEEHPLPGRPIQVWEERAG
jgi:hypothetical protein